MNGIPFSEDGSSFGEVFTAIENLFVDFALLVETNLEWRHGEVLNVAQAAANAACGPAHLVTTTSDTP